MGESLSVVKGMTITPPVIGRISMGHTELRGKPGEEKALPVKDDHFTITTLLQQENRRWEKHPIHEQLVQGQAQNNAGSKLRAIPVRVAFNSLGLSLNNSFSCFDTKTGRVVCAGDGEKAKRATEDGVKQIDCPKPEACEYGVRNRCKSFTRFYTQIDGQEDPLGYFCLRSTSYNSLNYLGSRLAQLHGLSGGKIAGMPLMLVLSAKTTTQSRRTPVYFADLQLRPGMGLIEALKAAHDYQAGLEQAVAGNSGDLFSQAGMEEALKEGLANGAFSDELEDADEWYSDDELLQQAAGNLQSRGLRGLDSLVGQSGGALTQEQQPAQSPALAVVPEQKVAA